MSATRKPYTLQRRILVLAVLFMTIAFLTLTAGVPLYVHFTTQNDVRVESTRALLSLSVLVWKPESNDEWNVANDEIQAIARLNPDFWYYVEAGDRSYSSSGQAPKYRDQLSSSAIVVDQNGNEICLGNGDFFRFGENGPDEVSIWRIDCESLSDVGNIYLEFGGISQARFDLMDKVLYEYTEETRKTRSLMPFLILVIFLAMLIAFAFRGLVSRVTEVASIAHKIGADSEHHQLPVDGIPAEILPLVEAFNDAVVRLEKANEKQSFFLAAAAHEIRTPLTILRTRVEGFPKGELKQEVAADLDRMGGLVSQLLALSRLSSDEVVQEPVDLVDAVKKIAMNRTPLAVGQGKDLAFEKRGDEVQVLGNRRHIQSAVANVIDNAIMHSPKGGTVNVTVDGASVIVTDEGSGVKPENVEQIFEPFYKNPPNKKGAGLGLALVKEIMKIYGGKVILENGSDSGATFRLSFRQSS